MSAGSSADRRGRALRLTSVSGSTIGVSESLFGGRGGSYMGGGVDIFSQVVVVPST